jgi:hypothetical protein
MKSTAPLSGECRCGCDLISNPADRVEMHAAGRRVMRWRLGQLKLAMREVKVGARKVEAKA